MDLSSAQPHAESSHPSEQMPRTVLNSSPEMGSNILNVGPVQQEQGATRNHSGLGECTNRHNNEPASTTGRTAHTTGVEDWVWENLVKDWSAQEKELLQQSWRESTLLTYRAPIRRWLRWCENKNIDPKTPQRQDLARFLADLSITEKLAYNTILLNKSAIATFRAGNKATSLSSDFLVRQVLKAVSITRPREVKSPI